MNNPTLPKTAVGRSGLARARQIGASSSALPLQTQDVLRSLLADASLSRNEIARRAGVSKGSVSKYAEMWGRTFDRSITAAATEAAVVDARARRVELADRLVEEAHAELSERRRIAAEDTRARADLSRSLASLIKAATDLDSAETDRVRYEKAQRGSGSDIDSWLDHMTGDGDATVTPIDRGRGA